jgi:hypothetical protein
MPVTAKLSKLFYERLGEEVANELVEWLNSVDATYKADLRELIEIHFARLHSELNDVGARIDTKLAAIEARFDATVAALEARFDTRLVALEARIDAKLVALEARFDGKLVALEARFDLKLAEQREFIERRLGEQTRWFYIAWAAQMSATIAVLLRLFMK